MYVLESKGQEVPWRDIAQMVHKDLVSKSFMQADEERRPRIAQADIKKQTDKDIEAHVAKLKAGKLVTGQEVPPGPAIWSDETTVESTFSKNLRRRMNPNSDLVAADEDIPQSPISSDSDDDYVESTSSISTVVNKSAVKKRKVQKTPASSVEAQKKQKSTLRPPFQPLPTKTTRAVTMTSATAVRNGKQGSAAHAIKKVKKAVQSSQAHASKPQTHIRRSSFGTPYSYPLKKKAASLRNSKDMEKMVDTYISDSSSPSVTSPVQIRQPQQGDMAADNQHSDDSVVEIPFWHLKSPNLISDKDKIRVLGPEELKRRSQQSGPSGSSTPPSFSVGNSSLKLYDSIESALHTSPWQNPEGPGGSISTRIANRNGSIRSHDAGSLLDLDMVVHKRSDQGQNGRENEEVANGESHVHSNVHRNSSASCNDYTTWVNHTPSHHTVDRHGSGWHASNNDFVNVSSPTGNVHFDMYTGASCYPLASQASEYYQPHVYTNTFVEACGPSSDQAASLLNIAERGEGYGECGTSFPVYNHGYLGHAFSGTSCGLGHIERYNLETSSGIGSAHEGESRYQKFTTSYDSVNNGFQGSSAQLIAVGMAEAVNIHSAASHASNTHSSFGVGDNRDFGDGPYTPAFHASIISAPSPAPGLATPERYRLQSHLALNAALNNSFNAVDVGSHMRAGGAMFPFEDLIDTKQDRSSETQTKSNEHRQASFLSDTISRINTASSEEQELTTSASSDMELCFNSERDPDPARYINSHGMMFNADTRIWTNENGMLTDQGADVVSGHGFIFEKHTFAEVMEEVDSGTP